MQKDEEKPATETQAWIKWVKEIAFGYKFLMSGFFCSIAIIKTKKICVNESERDCVCVWNADNINKEEFIVYVFLFTIILLIKRNSC